MSTHTFSIVVTALPLS